MTQLLFRNPLGHEVAPPMTLPPARRRLSAVVRRHLPAEYRPTARPVMVSVHRRNDPVVVCDQTIRLRNEWGSTVVNRRDTIVIVVLPQGGGGGNSAKQIGAALAAVALTALAGPIGTAVSGALFAGSTTAAAIISAGITIGASVLLSLASKPKANKEDNQAYGVTGGGVLPRPGERIPVIYGRCWHQPDLTQPDYMQYENNNQVLYKRMVVGLGEYTVHKIRVGETVMWDAATGVGEAFPGVQVDVINPGETTTLVPSSVLSSSQVTGNELPRPGDVPEWSGPFILGSPGQTYTRIQIDWSAPRGVFWRDGNGRIRTAYVKCLWQYAPVDNDGNTNGPWQTLLSFNSGYATAQALRRTEVITVPAGRYAVRAKNEREEATDTWTDTVNWDGLRALLNDVTVRPNVTEIAMKIPAGPQLGITTFSDLMVEVTRKLPVWNGSAWVVQETRKAVWAYADVLRNTAYGGAISDGMIDIGKIASYAAGLSEFDTFDGVIRGPVSTWEAASTVLFALRAEPLFLGNLWSFSRDEPTSARRTLFTSRQMKVGTTSINYTLSTEDGGSDVIVSYYAGGDPLRPRETRSTIGAETLTPRRIELTGVVDYRHAKHLAIWLAAVAAYRRKRITFEAELDGRLLDRGSLFGAHVWFETGRAVGVASFSGNTLNLTADIQVNAGEFLMIRDARGRQWGPVRYNLNTIVPIMANATNPIGAGNGQVLATMLESGVGRSINLSAQDVANVEAALGQSLASALASSGEDPSIYITTGDLVALDWLTQSVEPVDRYTTRVSGVAANNAVWQALGETIPDIPNLPGVPGINNAPRLQWVRAYAAQHTSSLEVEWQVSPVAGLISLVVDLSYDDGATWARIYAGTETAGTAPLRMSDNPVKVRAAGIGTSGNPTGFVFTEFSTGTVDVPQAILPPPEIVDVEALLPSAFARLNELELKARDFADAAAELLRSVWVAREQGEQSLTVAQRTLRQYTDNATEALAEIIDQVQAELVSLENAQIGQAGAISALQASVTNIDGLLTVTAQQVNALTARITTTEGAVVGQATAISGLQASVTSINGSVTALSQSVTSLQSQINNANGTIAGQATAISVLQTEVTNVSGQVTAVAQSVTNVEASVGLINAQGTFSVQALAAPGGAVARVGLGARASNGSWTASASIFLDAFWTGSAYGTQIVLDANNLFFTGGGAGKVNVLAANGNGVWISTNLFVGPSQKIVLDGVNGVIDIFR